MKVCLVGVVPSSVYGFRKGLIYRLRHEGCSVTALVDKKASAREGARILNLGVNLHGYHVSRRGTNPFRDLLTFFHLVYKISKIKPDIIVTYTIKPNIYGVLAARILGVRCIFAMVEGAGFSLQEEESSSGLRKAISFIVKVLYKSALIRSDRVVFLNEDNVKMFLGLGLVEEKQVMKIPGIGVSLKEYPYVVKKKFNENVKFLMVARLLKEKGVVEYLEAIEIVKSSFPNAEFHLVGRLDDSQDSISSQYLQYYIDNNLVRYHGHVTSVLEFYEDCDVFVLPSYHEGMPCTTMEAMATGRAVITTDSPGCRETVVDGYNGYEIEARSVASLVAAIKRCIEFPSDLEEMGVNSRKMVEDRFDEIEINKEFFQLIKMQYDSISGSAAG